MKKQPPKFRILIDGTKDFWATSIDHFIESDKEFDDLWSACSERLEDLIIWLKVISPERAKIVEQYRFKILEDPMNLRHVIMTGTEPNMPMTNETESSDEASASGGHRKHDDLQCGMNVVGSHFCKLVNLKDVETAFENVQAERLYVANKIPDIIFFNAHKGMGIPKEDEVLAIYNAASFWNHGDEGFAITPRGIYTRVWPEKPRFILWSKISHCKQHPAFQFWVGIWCQKDNNDQSAEPAEKPEAYFDACGSTGLRDSLVNAIKHLRDTSQTNHGEKGVV